MKKEKTVIKALKNGPLQVKNLERFTNSRDEKIEIKSPMRLCRCGSSRNKPFCDGTHVSKGFKDEKLEDRVSDKKETYPGKKITIHDNRGICSHAGFCTDNLPLVFRAGQEPWIDPDAAEAAEVMRVIEMCPSGALSYSVDGVEKNNFHEKEEIHIAKNGPYYVRGAQKVEGIELEKGASTEHYTLCRCGHSHNKPRCDGSHWYAAFKDDEALTISAANHIIEQNDPVWYKVAEPDELKNNQTKKLYLESQAIVLTRIKDKYGALDGVCSHQGGPLVDGNIHEAKIRCPWHGHIFDPIKGNSLSGDPDIQAYKVEEREDGIYIEVTASKRSEWTVSHVMVETMVNWGIRHVFGIVGHSNLGLAEAFRIQEEKGRLKYIGVRHENAAAFAASAYSKLSDTLAVCFSIAGPGATNLLTGLWDAKMDRTPVLALTGQVNTQFLGPGAFQEVDLPAAFEAVSAFSKTVLSGSRHNELVNLAIKTALIQRDVVHLIVPDEVQMQDAGTEGPGMPDGRLSDKKITPSGESIDLAMYRLWKSKRPAIIVGYGARHDMEDIIALAKNLRAPILTTFKAKGQIPDSHPLAAGVLGRSGTPVSAHFMNTADLLIVFGSSFSQHTGIDKNKPIIQVDFDQMALAKFHPVDNPIWGDVGICARIFNQKLSTFSQSIITEKEISMQWKNWRQEKKEKAAVVGNNGLNPAFIMKVLSLILPQDAVIALDVGNNTYSFGRYFESKNQTVLLSGYLGSIGFSFPAAMGAVMAQDVRPVISLSGDGGFAQYMAEFNTAVLHNMNITHILLNNNELGKISKEQRDTKLPVWQTKLSNPDFAQYANECGGLGIKVINNSQLEGAVKKALAYKGPSLVEIVTDPELN